MGREHYYGPYIDQKNVTKAMGKAGYLFSKWGYLEKRLKGKFIYLFLDYDGTLAPIVERPEKAVIPEKTLQLLGEISGMPNRRVAIVSGRSLGDVMGRVGLKKITYVGNHGFEMSGSGARLRKTVSAEYEKTLVRLKSVLKKRLSSIKGAFLEDKGLSVTVHYRQVAKKDISVVKAVLRDALDVPGIRDAVRVRNAKMAVEIRPPVEWDKGMAVIWLLSKQKAKLAGEKHGIIPIYAGDDATDEDAFRALDPAGITVSVGNRDRTSARYFIKDTSEVAALLRKVRDLGLAVSRTYPRDKRRKGL